jgi:hypothetical protein
MCDLEARVAWWTWAGHLPPWNTSSSEVSCPPLCSHLGVEPSQ